MNVKSTHAKPTYLLRSLWKQFSESRKRLRQRASVLLPCMDEASVCGEKFNHLLIYSSIFFIHFFMVAYIKKS